MKALPAKIPNYFASKRTFLNELKLVKGAFGETVGGTVTSGETYASSITVEIDGDTEGAVCWRRRHTVEEKGDVWERDRHGNKVDVGDVWVEKHTWEGTIDVLPKDELLNAPPPED